MYNVIIFTDTTDNIVSIPSLGPYKCAHVLRKAGYSCLVVNHLSDYTQQELKELIDSAVGSNTLLIGFGTNFIRSTQIERDPEKPTPPYPEIGTSSVFPQGKDFENEILAYIKSKNSNIKTVAGGVRVNPNYDNKNINYVCLGYSEISIVNLANHLSKGEPLKHNTRNIFGVIVLDDKFAAAYHFASEDMIWQDTDVVNHKTLPIEIGRGCIFKCKFCSYPMNGKHTLDFVKHPDILKRELEHNYEQFGITHYQIVDDTFNDHIEKLKTIANVVKQLTFQPKFWAYTRLDLFCTRPETAELLYDIGLRSLFFGIETLNPKTGRIIGKGYDPKKLVKMIEHIRTRYPDVSMHGSFIAGLPRESMASLKSTADRVMTQDIPLNSWMFYPLYIPEPSVFSFNSDITNNMTEYGYTKQGSLGTYHVDWKNEHMTFAEAKEFAERVISDSRNLDQFKLEGTLSFPLTTMGFDLTMLKNTAWKDFDFQNVEYNVRPAFVQQYKSKLLQLVRSKYE